MKSRIPIKEHMFKNLQFNNLSTEVQFNSRFNDWVILIWECEENRVVCLNLIFFFGIHD